MKSYKRADVVGPFLEKKKKKKKTAGRKRKSRTA